MQIANLKLDNLPGVSIEPPVPTNQRQRSSNCFDDALQEANRKQAYSSEQPAPKEQVERSSYEKQETADNYTYQEKAAVDEYIQTYAPPETKEYVTLETVYITNHEAPEFAKALQYVAEAAALPAEAIKEWLVKESVNLHELHEPETSPKFVEYAIGKKAPAELLTDPVLPEIHKAIQEAVEVLKKPQEAPVQNEAVVVVKEAQKNTAPLIKADIEGLEVLEEDGEVIITKKTGEAEYQGENSNPNSNPNSSNSASTANQAAATTTNTAGPTAAAPQSEAVLTYLQPVAAVQDTYMPQPQQTAETARPTLTQTPINAQDVINQIMTQVKVASSGQNFTEMRMTLRPESLGEIMLRVITQNGIVMAQFEAESQRIKETLESNFNQLRDALTEAGIAFGELNVFVRQEGEERLNQFERERLAARRRMESILAEEEIDVTKDPLHSGILDEVA